MLLDLSNFASSCTGFDPCVAALIAMTLLRQLKTAHLAGVTLKNL